MKRFSNSKALGLGILEIALLLMVASLALIPLTNMIGKGSAGDGSSLTTINRQRTREMVAANNIMERALSGEVLSQNISNENELYNSLPNNQFNLNTIPVNGDTVYYPSKTDTYDYGDSTQGVRLKYRWTLVDVSHERDRNDQLNWDETTRQSSSEKCNPYNTYDSRTNACWTQITPKGNRVVKATLNVFDLNSKNTNKPTYTFSTFLFGKGSYAIPENPRVGIAILLDTSNSMLWYRDPNSNQVIKDGHINKLTTPYLKDRFHREDALAGSLSASNVKLYDDRNLDITWSLPTDDSTTPYKDNYLKKDVLGFPNCNDFKNRSKKAIDWFVYRDSNDSKLDRQHEKTFKHLCNNGSYNMSHWETKMVPYISRIEAARNALLGFLVALEDDLELVQNMEMSFVTFEIEAKVRVPLEVAQLEKDPANFNAERPRFKEIRDKFSWLNRYDEKYGFDKTKSRMIFTEGRTQTRYGMEEAVAELNKGKNLTVKLIILLTDGAPYPNEGDNTNEALVKYAKFAKDKHNISTYTIGFAGVSQKGQEMLRDMAKESKGQFYYANDPNELREIFNALSYELRREMVLARVERYNSQLSNQLR